MKIKILVCLSIFLLLFSTAWLLQEKNGREFNDNQTEFQTNNLEGVQLNTQNSLYNNQLNTQVINTKSKLYKSFKPREYVRIEQY